MHTLVVRTKAFCYYATIGCSRQQDRVQVFPLSPDGLNLDLVLTTNYARILKEFGVGGEGGGMVCQGNLEKESCGTRAARIIMWRYSLN